MRLRRLLSLVTSLTLSAGLRAQSAPQDTLARFAGTVVRDSAGGGGAVANARVVIPRLGREAVTDASGAFRLDGLPAGSFEVNVRAIGAPAVRRLVVFEPGETLTQRFALGGPVARLDAVRVEADSTLSLSPTLHDFEERRHGRTGGQFITPDDFRRAGTNSLATLLSSKMSGLRVLTRSGTSFVASARSNSPKAFMTQGPCWVTLYIDGLLYFDATMAQDGQVTMAGKGTPPDLDRIGVREFVAAEYYTPASIPPQYNRTSTVCGTLLLWSKAKVTP